MLFLYMALSLLYIVNIEPERGLPASFQSLHVAIDFSFSSSISESHQNLKKFFLRLGTAVSAPNVRIATILLYK